MRERESEGERESAVGPFPARKDDRLEAVGRSKPDKRGLPASSILRSRACAGGEGEGRGTVAGHNGLGYYSTHDSCNAFDGGKSEIESAMF